MSNIARNTVSSKQEGNGLRVYSQRPLKRPPSRWGCNQTVSKKLKTAAKISRGAKKKPPMVAELWSDSSRFLWKDIFEANICGGKTWRSFIISQKNVSRLNRICLLFRTLRWKIYICWNPSSFAGNRHRTSGVLIISISGRIDLNDTDLFTCVRITNAGDT